MNPPVVSSLGHQLMAVSIDEQIRRLLHKWVAVSLDGYKDGTSVAFEPESELVVNLTYYMLSFISMKPTPGMQAIKYRIADSTNNTSHRKPKILIFCILLIWLYKRGKLTALVEDWRNAPERSVKHTMKRLLDTVDTISKIAGFSNSLLFLITGSYPSLLYRCSSYHMVPNRTVNIGGLVPSGTTNAQLYLKARYLLWEIWSGIVIASTVAVNFNEVTYYFNHISYKLRQVNESFSIWLKNTLPLPIAIKRLLFNEKLSRKIEHDGIHTQNYICSLCRTSPPENPYKSNCDHIFCYVCISECLSTDQLRCPDCFKILKVARRFSNEDPKGAYQNIKV